MKKKFRIQDNLIPRRFVVISFSLAFLILLSFSVLAQVSSGSKKINGYWEGEFMPGSHLTMILHFQESDEGVTIGRILLYQDENPIQNDPLSDIQVDGNQLAFMIKSKNTPFAGAISSDGQQITGKFQFPDNSVHQVQLTKVVKPSKGSVAEENQGSSLNQKYSVAQLQSDFDFLRKHLEQTHPQLYLYTSKENFDRLFEQTYASIRNEMTEDEFFRLIAPLVEKVHCCHTGIRPSEAYEKMMADFPGFLPLDIWFIGDKAYVINDYRRQSRVKKGTQVLAINGKTVKEIYNRLMDCIPSDGYNQTAKTFEIDNHFSQVYARYLGSSKSFNVTCLSPSGDKIELSMDALTGKELEEAMKMAHPERYPTGALPVSLKIDEKTSTAILKIYSFGASNPDEYIAFLQKAFTKLKSDNIKHLIIDVRGNKGGHPFFGAELLSYLAQSDFIYFKEPAEQPEFAPLYHLWPVKEDVFDGDIYVLMDGGCLSTTGHFLSLVRYHQLGTLIGEASGGSFYCNDGSIQMTLPETGIQINLPRVTFETAVSGFKMGDPLLPDHEVKSTLDDLLNGRDAVMEYTMKMIKD